MARHEPTTLPPTNTIIMEKGNTRCCTSYAQRNHQKSGTQKMRGSFASRGGEEGELTLGGEGNKNRVIENETVTTAAISSRSWSLSSSSNSHSQDIECSVSDCEMSGPRLPKTSITRLIDEIGGNLGDPVYSRRKRTVARMKPAVETVQESPPIRPSYGSISYDPLYTQSPIAFRSPLPMNEFSAIRELLLTAKGCGVDQDRDSTTMAVASLDLDEQNSLISFSLDERRCKTLPLDQSDKYVAALPIENVENVDAAATTQNKDKNAPCEKLSTVPNLKTKNKHATLQAVQPLQEKHMSNKPQQIEQQNSSDQNVISLLDPQPENLVNDLMRQHKSSLCKLNLRLTDVPFLFDSSNKLNKLLRAENPLLVIPGDNGFVFARDLGRKGFRLLSQRESENAKDEPQNLDLESDEDAKQITVRNVSSRTALSAVVEGFRLASEAKSIRNELKRIRERYSSQRSSETPEARELTSLSESTQSFLTAREESDSRNAADITSVSTKDNPFSGGIRLARTYSGSPSSTRICLSESKSFCEEVPSLSYSGIPSPTQDEIILFSPIASEATCSLFQDDELRQIFKNQEEELRSIFSEDRDISNLASSMSVEADDYSFVESDDGLGEELGALQAIEELRHELEIADELISKPAPQTPEVIPPPEFKKLKGILPDLKPGKVDETPESTTLSLAAPPLKPKILSSSHRQKTKRRTTDSQPTFQVEETPISQSDNERAFEDVDLNEDDENELVDELIPSVRRVRFADFNQEFVFERDPMFHEEQMNDGFNDIITTCGDIFYAVEDAIDELGFVCAKFCQVSRFTEPFSSSRSTPATPQMVTSATQTSPQGASRSSAFRRSAHFR